MWSDGRGVRAARVDGAEGGDGVAGGPALPRDGLKVQYAPRPPPIQ